MQSLTLDEQSIINEASRLSLSAFTEELGYKNAPFHLEWYDYLQNEFSPFKIDPAKEHRILQLWPRGHGKSECTTMNYVSWLVGNYPDIHINIVTKTSSLSEEILLALMTRFESDERYREIFGDLKPSDSRKWTTHEIIVNRTEISKNPTIKATGLMGPITGGRSDIVICDDIIDEENVHTELQIDKVLTWFNKVLFPTLYPWGAIIVIGTRWNYADLYAHLLKSWPHSVKQAIQTDKDGAETGRVLWPEYWSLEKLEERRKQIGTIFFSCQYQNDPTSMMGDLLKAEWLHPWEQMPPPNLPVYAGIDPSLGESDYFGIASFAYDAQNKQGFLLDVWCEHMPFPQILTEKLPQLNRAYHYSKIYMETNFWQKLLLKMPELQGYPIVPVQTVKNKEQRFIPMSSHFQAKRVLVNPLMLNQNNEFYTEWIQFPRGKHDDALDCVELVASNTLSPQLEIYPAFVFG